MILSLGNFVPWFVKYKYAVIFPIAIIEGPIIMIISGFLVSLGYLSWAPAFLTLVIGDVVGDTIYYAMGKYGGPGFVHRYGHYLGLNIGHIENLERFFSKHTTRKMLIGKATHGVGNLLWIASGLAGVRYSKFIAINTFGTAVKVAALILVGYYYGQAYPEFSFYLNMVAIAFIVAFVVFYVTVIRTDKLAAWIEKM